MKNEKLFELMSLRAQPLDVVSREMTRARGKIFILYMDSDFRMTSAARCV